MMCAVNKALLNKPTNSLSTHSTSLGCEVQFIFFIHLNYSLFFRLLHLDVQCLEMMILIP